jgi:hypothetical protein
MKRNLLAFSLVASLAFIACSAFSDAPTMRVNVPFDFYAGNEQLPAGEYTFEMESGLVQTGSKVTIRTNGGAGICFLLTMPETDASSAKLLFNKYGNKHFLSSVSIKGFKAGLKAQRLEKELRAQTAKPDSIAIVAQK